MIYRNDIPLSISRKKHRAIIYYLAANNKPVSKEKVQFIFWPDSNPTSAKHNLSVYLYEIKKYFPNLIFNDREYLRITESTDVDVRLFESGLSNVDAIGQSDLKDMIDLYLGDFLDGFTLLDSPEFESWKTMEQEHYVSLYIRGLAGSAAYHKNKGDYQQSIMDLQEALNLDPLQESLYREIMLLHYKSGDYLKVSQTYSKIKEILQNEIGISPMSETEALYNSIMTNKHLENSEEIADRAAFELSVLRPINEEIFSTPIHQETSSLSIPFVGRDHELRRLEIELLTCKQGLVLIEGTSGIGKTRFVHEFMKTWEGITLYASCPTMGEDTTYQPIISAIKTLFASSWKNLYIRIKGKINLLWWGYLRWLMPEIDPFETETPYPPPNSFQLREAIKNFLFVLSEYKKILLIIDDLNRASDDTIAFLVYLIHQTSKQNLFFLATQSPHKTNYTLARIKQELNSYGLLRCIELNRLDKHCTDIFARQIHDSDNPELTEWLERKAMGNPLIMTEFVTYIRDMVDLPGNSSLNTKALIQSTIMPSNVEHYLAYAFTPLSPNASKLLNAASVYGSTFDYHIVYKLTDLSASDALDALEEAMAAGFIWAKNSHEYYFHHSILADFIYQKLSPSRRQYLHLRIAEAIESTPEFILENKLKLLTRHFSESSQPEKATPYAIEAGDNSVKVAKWKEALSYYETACQYDFTGALPFLVEVHYYSGNISKLEAVCSEGTATMIRLGHQDWAILYKLESTLARFQQIRRYFWSDFPNTPEPNLSEDIERDILEAKQFIMQSNCALYLNARLHNCLALFSALQGKYADALQYYEFFDNIPRTDITESMIRLAVIAKLFRGVCAEHLGALDSKEILSDGMHFAKDNAVSFCLPLYLYNYGMILAKEGDFGHARTMLVEAERFSKELELGSWISAIQACIVSFE